MRSESHPESTEYPARHKAFAVFAENPLPPDKGRLLPVPSPIGVGLMQGLVCKEPVGGIINKAMEKGLILINAGSNIIRFVPALIISKEHVDEMTDILRECLSER